MCFRIVRTLYRVASGDTTGISSNHALRLEMMSSKSSYPITWYDSYPSRDNVPKKTTSASPQILASAIQINLFPNQLSSCLWLTLPSLPSPCLIFYTHYTCLSCAMSSGMAKIYSRRHTYICLHVVHLPIMRGAILYCGR